MLTYKNSSSHLRIRQGIYHFVRRVPSDLQQYYKSDRISLSLKTRSHNHALRTASSINQRLDDYWLGLRLKEMDVPALHLLVEDGKENEHSSPTILEALDIYLRIKRNSNPTFVRAVKKNTKYLERHWAINPLLLTLLQMQHPLEINYSKRTLALGVLNASLVLFVLLSILL